MSSKTSRARRNKHKAQVRLQRKGDFQEKVYRSYVYSTARNLGLAKQLGPLKGKVKLGGVMTPQSFASLALAEGVNLHSQKALAAFAEKKSSAAAALSTADTARAFADTVLQTFAEEDWASVGMTKEEFQSLSLMELRRMSYSHQGGRVGARLYTKLLNDGMSTSEAQAYLYEQVYQYGS